MFAKIARTSLTRSARSFVTSTHVSMSDQFNKHRDTADNNDDTPFEFTEENMRKVETVLGKYPDNYKQRYVQFVTIINLIMQGPMQLSLPLFIFISILKACNSYDQL